MTKILTFLILSLFAFSMQIHASDPIPVAEQGILDLRDYADLMTQMPLKGEWEFYWKKLMPSNQFENNKFPPSLYAVIPSYWNQYKTDIPDVTGKGYGTYRLRVLFPENFSDTLSMHVPIFDSSFDMFLNGIRIGGNGVVGKNAASNVAEYAPFIYSFQVESDTMEILIHVANFHHRQGGFWKNIALGTYEEMNLKAERKKFATHTSSGILLIFSVFFFILNIMDRRDKIMLYFSLSVFGMFLRSIATVYFPITFFLDIPWEWHVKIEYLGTYMGFAFGLLYLNSLFPSKLLKKLTLANTIIFGLMIFLVLIARPAIFTYSIFVFEVIVILFLSYYMIRSFLGIFKKKRIETIFFFSFILFLGAVINDILISLSSKAISYDYFTTIVFQLFILSQAILLIGQWLSDYREKIVLSNELEYINRNLENIIEDRTHELNLKNSRLDSALQLKNKLFSIIAHDLKSPVAGLAQYSDLLLKDKETRTDDEIIFSLNHLAYSTVDLIDNLLYWGMSQKKGIQYNPEEKQLISIYKEVQNLFEQNLKSKRLKLISDIPENLWVYCDTTLVKMIFRNLITNAIKFSNEEGQISIIANENNKMIEVSVEDKGIGMQEDQIDRLLKNKGMESTMGTANEKGTGLGLSLVMDLVKINKGTLDIQSKPGKGTKIMFTLPGNHEI